MFELLSYVAAQLGYAEREDLGEWHLSSATKPSRAGALAACGSRRYMFHVMSRVVIRDDDA
jgi:hypothetical protein